MESITVCQAAKLDHQMRRRGVSKEHMQKVLTNPTLCDDMAEVLKGKAGMIEETTGRVPWMDAFHKMVAQIRSRCQQQLGTSLKIEHDPGYPEGSYSLGYYYFLETKWKRKWNIVPYRKQRKVFGIGDPKSYGYSKITTAVFDESILGIVKEELQKFSDVFSITFDLVKQFA